MKRFFAHDFVEAAFQMGRLETVTRNDPKREVSSQLLETLKGRADQVADMLEESGLPFSAKTARRATEFGSGTTYSDLNHWFGEFHRRLKDELQGTTLFALNPDTVHLYTEPSLFGETVAERFSSTAFDIEEAGKCLALSLGTACVFHLMRVLEGGLYALGSDLGITKLQENWQNAIEQIEKAIRDLPKADPRKTPYSEAAAHFMNVKDAWRNHTAHIGQVYPDEKAQQILDSVKAFMQTLATQLSEVSS